MILELVFTYMVQIKFNTQTPCFVVEILLVDGVMETTYKVPIFTKIYTCKIQEQSAIILSKNKSYHDFFTPCNMRQQGDMNILKKITVDLL